MQNDPLHSFHRDNQLRVAQPNSIEPIVYQSNQSIVSNFTASQSISTVDQLSSSQSTLSSYLPRSGLNSLNDVPSCHIHQIYELNESLSIASENRFTVKTYDNHSIFLASEGSTQRDRMLWGSSRPFMLHLTDQRHQQAITLRRIFGCHCFCFPLKMQCMEVWLHSGVLLGVVQEKFSITSREFVIENERGEALYVVNVSLGSSLCMDKEFHFPILTADKAHQGGTIVRQWNSDINTFTMNIYFADPTMDSKIKSLFLGLGFLLDYLFFQSRSCC
ncbi:CLUMA_CG017996, isoform A [Clunio marinus]|uniref:Phospholipid scramblase n=1 Tax=Clunio marinus TaxID=568069 RepID=A0A1J1IXT9_9DIPT|nr:CLUMA_CG017996, isoform A [Clunio marinus]